MSMVGLVERIFAHPATTLTGVGLAGIFWYLLGTWHCQLPKDGTDWIKWATVVGPAILGMLAKDV